MLNVIETEEDAMNCPFPIVNKFRCDWFVSPDELEDWFVSPDELEDWLDNFEEANTNARPTSSYPIA